MQAELHQPIERDDEDDEDYEGDEGDSDDRAQEDQAAEGKGWLRSFFDGRCSVRIHT